MSLTTIVAPSAANRLAIPRPNPEPAPVTIAILLPSRIAMRAVRWTGSGDSWLHTFPKCVERTAHRIYVSFLHQTTCIARALGLFPTRWLHRFATIVTD